MNKLILSILLAAGVAFAGPCDGYIKYANKLDYNIPPLESGLYKLTIKDDVFLSGEIIEVGSYLKYVSWNIPSLNIQCNVRDKEQKNYYDEVEQEWNKCFILEIYCEVENKTQFIENIKWNTNVGYRKKDGTRKWGREYSGSTDILCYDKNGMEVIKRVNDPFYCK